MFLQNAIEFLPILLKGAIVTIEITVCSFVLRSVLGLVLALVLFWFRYSTVELSAVPLERFSTVKTLPPSVLLPPVTTRRMVNSFWL